MRRYSPLRPKLFAEEMQVIIAAVAERRPVDIMREAGRIAGTTGVSATVIASELNKAVPKSAVT
jgi:hypothetical protein